MKTQICLVSAQAAANLLSALDPALKPEKIVLVTSPKMQSQAIRLSEVLRSNGIVVERHELTDEHDYQSIEVSLLDLASSLDGDQVALNTTGGTKLMSIAAHKVAECAQWEAFYVDLDTDRICWLNPSERAGQPLKEQLRLTHYLRSYGFTLPPKTSAPTRPTAPQRQLIGTLLHEFNTLQTALGTLNGIAQRAEDEDSLLVQLTEFQNRDAHLEALLRHFGVAGALSRQGNTVQFHGSAERQFVKGGWLELHVSDVIHNMAGDLGIRDFDINVEVEDDNKVKNELDMILMARNRLYVIECKTARFESNKRPKANDAIFKLVENSRRIGGSGAKGMLVSYRSFPDASRRLADALSIRLVCGRDIRRLPEMLKKWVAN